MHPVLLVHGINDTGARFKKMRDVLETRGFRSVHAINLTPPDGSITLEAMGEQVIDGVRACRDVAGSQMIDIVAFSMGALAARSALHDPDVRSSVRRFVSISGPHHGTVNAHLSWKSGTRQMRPGSRFLRDLEMDAERWGEIEVYSFWSPFDLVVIPARSSVLEGAQNRSFLVAVHHWMLSDDRVIAAVVQALSE
ncbi:MAG: lipase [Coriobacteriia bacterium]|nr:lipase [Coriobacteriia bacterium]